MSHCHPAVKALFASLLLAAGLAHAEKADQTKPMTIDADQGFVDQKNQTRTATGNVIVKQGTMTLTATKLISKEDKAGNQSMNGSGNPVKFRQKLDSGEWLDAEALRVEYNASTGEMRLLDKAWVKRGQDEVFSDVITYNTTTEIYQAQGAKGGSGRVSITIQPKKTASQPEAK
ncbi:lipopolysaccharide transport periplasmic protein LptA [Andreprevotia chitinilytica]|uniref:lipopolysaccharide transport periplasmic protein LptA n=1 Tax=Andreprevotia chitinilytica TaxID=396808 RepID=UPI000555FFF5|nr:lipopolysaccharide transport periplasmic protein LptA [Andreprevotia chitinilytica]